jgi:hypothetical protein
MEHQVIERLQDTQTMAEQARRNNFQGPKDISFFNSFDNSDAIPSYRSRQGASW